MGSGDPYQGDPTAMHLIMIFAAAILVAPPPTDIQARAAAERKRTAEIRQENKQQKAAEKAVRQGAILRRTTTIHDLKKNPQWMETVERIESDERAPRTFEKAKGSSDAARSYNDRAMIAAYNASAPTRYEVFFKDGRRELYNGSGYLVGSTPAPKK